MIDVSRHGSVDVVELQNGKVNALDADLLQELVSALRRIEGSDARAVVVTGAGRAFSAGLDLQAIVDGGADYLDRLIPNLIASFDLLFAFALPVVAAVNGAAVAGGCILACACDRRILAEGARIGASELLVGVPFPVSALELLRWACGDRTEEVAFGGKLYASGEALSVGLAHEVVPSSDLLTRAVAAGEALGAIPTDAFRLAKTQLRRPTVERVAAYSPVFDPEVKALWSAPETTARLRAQLERMAAPTR